MFGYDTHFPMDSMPEDTGSEFGEEPVGNICAGHGLNVVIAKFDEEHPVPTMYSAPVAVKVFPRRCAGQVFDTCVQSVSTGGRGRVDGPTRNEEFLLGARGFIRDTEQNSKPERPYSKPEWAYTEPEWTYATRVDTCISSDTKVEHRCIDGVVESEPVRCANVDECIKGVCVARRRSRSMPGSFASTEISGSVPKPGRPRRHSTLSTVTFEDAFPKGYCGCGPKFPESAKGSYFSIGKTGPALLEAQLEGLTRTELGQLYLHPKPGYFGRLGFSLHGISLEHATVFAVTAAPLGFTIEGQNDEPVLSVTGTLAGGPYQAGDLVELSLPWVLTDEDALDGTFRLTLTTASGVHRFWLPQLDQVHVRLLDTNMDPAEPLWESNGKSQLVIEGLISEVEAALATILLEVRYGYEGVDFVIINATDAFWSPTDHGGEGAADLSTEFIVASAAALPHYVMAVAGGQSDPSLASDNYTIPHSLTHEAYVASLIIRHDGSGLVAVDRTMLTVLDPVGDGSSVSIVLSMLLPVGVTTTLVQPIDASVDMAIANLSAFNLSLDESHTDCIFKFEVAYGTSSVDVMVIPSHPISGLLFCSSFTESATGAPNSENVCFNYAANGSTSSLWNCTDVFDLGGLAPEWTTTEDSTGALLGVELDLGMQSPASDANTRFHAVLYAKHGSVTASNADATMLNVATHTMAGPDELAKFAGGRYLHLVSTDNDATSVISGLANFTYTPEPGFSGNDTITLVVVEWVGDSVLPLRQATDDELVLFGATSRSRVATVIPVADVPVLFVPGYIYIRELEKTQIQDLDVYHQDPYQTIKVKIAVGMGMVSLADDNAAGVVVNEGVAPTWPASSFEFEGPLAAAMSALHGVVFHASACDSAPGQCDSRFTLLNVTATDLNNASSTRSIVIDVTCIAEVPLLDVEDAVGLEDAPIPVFIASEPRDPAEKVRIVIKDIPAGVSFNGGQPTGLDWKLDLTELPGLEVSWIPDSHEDFNLTVFSYAFEPSNGDVAWNETTVLVTVNPVNDRPNIAAPGTQVAIEDTVSKIAAAAISDVKDLPGAASGTYEATVKAMHGTLYYELKHGNESLSVAPSCNVLCNGFNTNTITLKGSMDDVNAALGTIWYLGDQDFDETDSIAYTVDDFGPLVTRYASDSTYVIVTPVNDPPVISMDSSSSSDTGCAELTDAIDHESRTCLPIVNNFHPREDCSIATYPGHGITVADVDDKGGNYTVWMQSKYGAWWLNDPGDAGFPDLSFERGDGANDTMIMFHGLLPDVKVALEQVEYLPSENFHGNDVLVLTLRELPADETAPEVVTVMYQFAVRQVNDAPMVGGGVSLMLLQQGGSTQMTVQVQDDQALNASAFVHTALDGDDTRVRVWMHAQFGSTFTLTNMAAGVGIWELDGLTASTGSGQGIMVEGTIDDVEDTLVDMQVSLNPALDGLSEATAIEWLRVWADDEGKSGFCDCTDGPSEALAPETACNKFGYIEHGLAVLPCIGSPTAQFPPLATWNPKGWYYGEATLTEYEDADADGEQDIAVGVGLKTSDTVADSNGHGVAALEFTADRVTDFQSYVEDSEPPVSDVRGDWSEWVPDWAWGDGGFGYANDASPCAHFQMPALGTDLTPASISRPMLRGWFWLDYGVVRVEVKLVSDQKAWLYVNEVMVGNHTPPENATCPTESTLRLPVWYAPDGASSCPDNTEECLGTSSTVNEISVRGSKGTTFLDAKLKVTKCDPPPACENTKCITDRHCRAPGCHCYRDEQDALNTWLDDSGGTVARGCQLVGASDGSTQCKGACVESGSDCVLGKTTTGRATCDCGDSRRRRGAFMDAMGRDKRQTDSTCKLSEGCFVTTGSDGNTCLGDCSNGSACSLTKDTQGQIISCTCPGGNCIISQGCNLKDGTCSGECSSTGTACEEERNVAGQAVSCNCPSGLVGTVSEGCKVDGEGSRTSPFQCHGSCPEDADSLCMKGTGSNGAYTCTVDCPPPNPAPAPAPTPSPAPVHVGGTTIGNVSGGCSVSTSTVAAGGFLCHGACPNDDTNTCQAFTHTAGGTTVFSCTVDCTPPVGGGIGIISQGCDVSGRGTTVSPFRCFGLCLESQSAANPNGVRCEGFTTAAGLFQCTCPPPPPEIDITVSPGCDVSGGATNQPLACHGVCRDTQQKCFGQFHGDPKTPRGYSCTCPELGICVRNMCGDGIVDRPVEECDDGNNMNNDHCTNACKWNRKFREEREKVKLTDTPGDSNARPPQKLTRFFLPDTKFTSLQLKKRDAIKTQVSRDVQTAALDRVARNLVVGLDFSVKLKKAPNRDQGILPRLQKKLRRSGVGDVEIDIAWHAVGPLEIDLILSDLSTHLTAGGGTVYFVEVTVDGVEETFAGSAFSNVDVGQGEEAEPVDQCATTSRCVQSSFMHGLRPMGP